MVVRTLDDIKKESSASGGTGMSGGMAPAANPWAGGGGAAAGGNYTTAGGYTPIPDQYSMGGVGPGDVFIDACGETVPVRALSVLPLNSCARMGSATCGLTASLLPLPDDSSLPPLPVDRWRACRRGSCR